jgi:hypothetical protein
LPDDLFDKKAGEQKPVKPLKKGVKRSFGETDMASVPNVNGESRMQKLTPQGTPTPAATPA